MMCTVEELWKRIDKALDLNEPESIEELYGHVMAQGDKEKNNRHEFYYAAGYLAYMHPKGKANQFVRNQAEKAFTLCLYYFPGFFQSVLYLAFIKMDEMRFLDALELLYSSDRGENIQSEQLNDRFVEAKIYCLVECGFWGEALIELEWFEQRVKGDPLVGLDLINFMKIVDKADPQTEVQENVLRKIKTVLDC